HITLCARAGAMNPDMQTARTPGVECSAMVGDSWGRTSGHVFLGIVTLSIHLHFENSSKPLQFLQLSLGLKIRPVILYVFAAQISHGVPVHLRYVLGDVQCCQQLL